MSTREEKRGRVQFTYEELELLQRYLWEEVKNLNPSVPEGAFQINLYFKIARAALRICCGGPPREGVRHEPG